MTTKKNKSLMRNLGSFFGHIVKAVRTDTAIEKKIVSKTVEETKEGDITLRRTTIEEIEIKRNSDRNSKHSQPQVAPKERGDEGASDSA